MNVKQIKSDYLTDYIYQKKITKTLSCAITSLLK